MVVHRFRAQLWAWQARGDAWVFVTVPPEVSDEIAAVFREPRGFGSVPVRVRVGDTTWDTSVFPSQEESGYVLPVKRPVRRAAAVEVGDEVDVRLLVREPGTDPDP